MDKITSFPKRCLLAGITVYQRIASPWVGQCCRFYPSCSQYAKEALQRYGFIYGSWLAISRLLKCHPWHIGGIDEVP